MCGITAFLRNDNSDCFDIVINSLKALQNRGYDSCGIIDSNFKSLLRTVKEDVSYINTDAIDQLILKKKDFPKNACVVMGHTRWATSGKKTIPNAHPHVSYDGKVAVIHNGIIENYIELKEELIKDGWLFHSETDTEVISNWVARELQSENIVEILQKASTVLKGTWAITLMHKDFPDSVYVARCGNPILIGYNETNGNIMVSSEIAGFVNQVTSYCIVKDNDVIHLKRGCTINQTFQKVPNDIIDITPGNFPYFMAKEIYDQVQSVTKPEIHSSLLPLKEYELFDLLLIGCGTSYNSGLSATSFFDRLPVRSVRSIVASEFTMNDLPKDDIQVISVFISQSGETLDTYRALKMMPDKVCTIAVVNVENSMIARECKYVIYLNAGREVGVESTKAYVTQIVALYKLSLFFTNKEIQTNISEQIKQVLDTYFPYKDDGIYVFECPKSLQTIVNALDQKNHGFILSTGNQIATAEEASLKIKEVGRVFIQGYPTASLKHGPFSLIQEGLPILFVLQNEPDSIRRTSTAIEEVHLRGASVYVITDIQDYKNEKVLEIITVPYNKTFSSILLIIPFQILSYYISCCRGLNCDCPVHLAKCVTTD